MLISALDLVPLRNVATWRSYVNVVSTLGRSIGGPIGGFLADTIGWRVSTTVSFNSVFLFFGDIHRNSSKTP